MHSERYWELKDNEEKTTPEASIEEFRELLKEVVLENSYADVKGGFFTSGGLDSSLVTAVSLIENKDSNYQQPISIQFEPNHVTDEKYGKIMEKHLNKSFEWVTITDELARETLENIIPFLDEPLENPIHVGTYLMAQRAKELGIKTVITGDGSDEFFLGYERHACWFNRKDPVAVYPSLHWTLTKDDAQLLYTKDYKAQCTMLENGYGQVIEPILNMSQALRYERGKTSRIP